MMVWELLELVSCKYVPQTHKRRHRPLTISGSSYEYIGFVIGSITCSSRKRENTNLPTCQHCQLSCDADAFSSFLYDSPVLISVCWVPRQVVGSTLCCRRPIAIHHWCSEASDLQKYQIGDQRLCLKQIITTSCRDCSHRQLDKLMYD